MNMPHDTVQRCSSASGLARCSAFRGELGAINSSRARPEPLTFQRGGVSVGLRPTYLLHEEEENRGRVVVDRGP